MILSDRDIKKALREEKITVVSEDNAHLKNIHASSLDLRLGRFFKIYEHTKFSLLDPADPETFNGATRLIELKKSSTAFIVQPHEFILGVTMEKIKLGDDLVARVEGRSSLGRLGIIVHSTAGFVDPGFEGTITLEITNINRMPVALYPGMRICQLAFQMMSSTADEPYHKKKCSKYQGQVFPEESRVYQDKEFKKR
jgi:dCTP deaminase